MSDESDFSDLDLRWFRDPLIEIGKSHRGGQRIRRGPQRARALRLPELIEKTGLTKEEVYELIESGHFRLCR